MAAVQQGDRSSLVCLTCKSGKRQCDKQWPICSRCKKLGRPCEYPMASLTGAVAEPFQSEPLIDKFSPTSCTRCRACKRRCDRLFPNCSRCLRYIPIKFSQYPRIGQHVHDGIGICCTYNPASSQQQAIAHGPSRMDFEELQLRVDFPLLEAGGVSFKPPIKYQSYMPELLEFFLTSIALPSHVVLADSLAYHLRSRWIEHAMSDPCLFHATLFSASASMDMLRGKPSTARTLHHQACAIRFINERLAQKEPVLTYGTLGAVLSLLNYNTFVLDRGTAVAHQKGLVGMLLATSESFRSDIGPLIAIIKVAMLSFACVYGTIPIWGCLFSESVRPNSLLRNIISRAALSTDRINFEKNTLDSVLDIYEAISRLDHLFHADRGTVLAEVERALSFAKSTQVDVASFRHHLSTSEKLNVCCQISCQLFWEMLRRQFESEKTLNTIAKYETRQLLTRLLQIEPSYWIQNAPEVFAWVAFTGAAASNCSDECVAFISNATTILSAVDGEKLTLLRQGWRYLRLLKRLCGDYNTLDDR